MNLCSGALQIVGDNISVWSAVGLRRTERGGGPSTWIDAALSLSAARSVARRPPNVSPSMDIYDAINTIGSLDVGLLLLRLML